MNAEQLPAYETVETLKWEDRELLLRIYYQAVETNGSVRQLNRTVYGDITLGELGLKRAVQDNSDYRQQMEVTLRLVKVALRWAWAVAGVCLALFGTLLGLVLDHMLAI
jgi:hypothetical protein